MAKPIGDAVYVSIAHPEESRKALLEAAKATIRIIQLNDSIRSIRTEKKELLIEFEQALVDIVNSFSKIKSFLPKVKMSDIPKLKNVRTESLMEREPVKEEAEEEEEPEKVGMTDEEKLEFELSNIEEKLRSL